MPARGTGRVGGGRSAADGEVVAMSDTMVTVLGNVATSVEYRETASGGMARFRLAVTPGRWDRERGVWVDGRTGFYTVFAWRALALNLAGSVTLGEPLIVHGRLRVREEERDGTERDVRDGPRRTFVDIEAVAVGHDLTRGTAAFRRAARPVSNVTARRPDPAYAQRIPAQGNATPGYPGPGHAPIPVPNPASVNVAPGDPVGSESSEGAGSPELRGGRTVPHDPADSAAGSVGSGGAWAGSSVGSGGLAGPASGDADPWAGAPENAGVRAGGGNAVQGNTAWGLTGEGGTEAEVAAPF